MSLTLRVGIALDLATAGFFVLVAVLLQRRIRGSGLVRNALRGSFVFWYAVAGFMLLDGGYAWIALQHEPGRLVQLVVLMLRRSLFVVGTAFLVDLLIVLRTGSPRHRPWLGAYYAAVLVLVEAVTLYQAPMGHVQETWAIQFVHSRVTPTWLNVLYGFAIFGPLAAGALFALGLYRDLETVARFRLGILCYSVLSFVVGILIGFFDNDWFWYGLFENRLAFTIALGMYFALRPPRLLRRRFPVLDDASSFPSLRLTRP